MTVEWWIALGAAAAVGALAFRSRDETIRMPGARSAKNEPPPDFERRLPRMSLEIRDSDFMGRWWQGTRRGDRVAFQPIGKGIGIYAGDFDPDEEQLASIYLTHVRDSTPLPAEGSVRRLTRALGNEGAELDLRFILNATGGDYAELRLSAVRSALLQLSDSIDEVAIYESMGVDLSTDESATAESIDADLDIALTIHRALREAR